MTDHFSKHENAEHENNGPICETWKYTGRENVIYIAYLYEYFTKHLIKIHVYLTLPN